MYTRDKRTSIVRVISEKFERRISELGVDDMPETGYFIANYV